MSTLDGPQARSHRAAPEALRQRGAAMTVENDCSEAATELPSVARLREVLRYEPETGKLFWRERPESAFTAPRYARSWNSKHAGKEAGKADVRGYRCICVWYWYDYAHRIAWAMTYGEWPTLDIDHIDQDPSNNRAANLREVAHQVNSMNVSMHRDNTSGCTGVVPVPSGRWQASVYCRGKRTYLGTFDSFDAAVAARRQAQDALGFSPTHGRAR